MEAHPGFSPHASSDEGTLHEARRAIELSFPRKLQELNPHQYKQQDSIEDKCHTDNDHRKRARCRMASPQTAEAHREGGLRRPRAGISPQRGSDCSGKRGLEHSIMCAKIRNVQEGGDNTQNEK